MILAHSGLYLSPIVSHALVGELGRGALLALVPLALEITNATLMSFYPTLVTSAPPEVQYPSFIALAGSVLFSTWAIADAMKAPERARARTGGLTLSALLDRDVKGLLVGGTFR
jgi:hypothetical protein